MTIVLNIAKQFSRSPAGRYLTDGPYSGQAFRENLLLPALRQSELVEVQLDGALGFGSSFLEEAFGGLVREAGLSAEILHEKIRISTKLKTYEQRIWSYVDQAKSKG
ncbi:MAG: STAS-like domain-containing protein [Rhodoferax sp.]|nr:STAS-like domain-containing protein [Rhodoferax sp.]